jgi:hypothetical protein
MAVSLLPLGAPVIMLLRLCMVKLYAQSIIRYRPDTKPTNHMPFCPN